MRRAPPKITYTFKEVFVSSFIRLLAFCSLQTKMTFEIGSGNVFADIGLEDPEVLLAKIRSSVSKYN